MKTTTSGRYPTTAEWLAKRDGVVVVAHVVVYGNGIIAASWGEHAHSTWRRPALDAVSLAQSTMSTHLLIKVNDDAQTIRVLVDGDDALVVVHVHDCGYHKSMKRGMQMALRGLKAARQEQAAYDLAMDMPTLGEAIA